MRSSGFCFVVCIEEIKACFYADGNIPVERKKTDDAGTRGKIAGAMSLSKQERIESSNKQRSALETNTGSSSLVAVRKADVWTEPG